MATRSRLAGLAAAEKKIWVNTYKKETEAVFQIACRSVSLLLLIS